MQQIDTEVNLVLAGDKRCGRLVADGIKMRNGRFVSSVESQPEISRLIPIERHGLVVCIATESHPCGKLQHDSARARRHGAVERPLFAIPHPALSVPVVGLRPIDTAELQLVIGKLLHRGGGFVLELLRRLDDGR